MTTYFHQDANQQILRVYILLVRALSPGAGRVSRRSHVHSAVHDVL